MFHLPSRGRSRRRGCPLVCLLLLAALCSVESSAQMGGIETDPGERGTGGQNMIQGRVFFPSGRMVDRRLKVRLSSVFGADSSALTDDSGSFSFRRLASGTYTVYVDAGKEYLPATERVDIMQPSRRGVPGTTYTLTIQLRPRPASVGGGGAAGGAGGSGGASAGVLNAAFAGVPKEALDLYEGALGLDLKGEHKQAIGLLKQAVELHPPFMLAYNEMGLQHFKLGDLGAAAAALRRATEMSPEAFSPLLNLGVVLFSQKEYEKSAAQLRLALKQRASSPNARFYLGRALIKLNRFAEAEKELRLAAETGDGAVVEAYRFLGGIYVETGDHKNALVALEKYLQLVPKAKDADAIRQIVAQLRTQVSKK